MVYHRGQATADEVAANGHIADALKKALEDRGWSVPDLNSHIGLARSNPTVYALMRAKTAPSQALRSKLGTALGLPVAVLTPKGAAPPAKKAARQVRPSVPRYGHIAATLRALLDREGMSAVDFGKRLGVKAPASTPHNWIAAKGAPSIALRAKIHEIWGIPLADLKPQEPINGTAPTARLVPAPPVARTASAPEPSVESTNVFAFTVSGDGNAHVTLDTTLPIERAWPLLELLRRLTPTETTNGE